jgi:hypothetical protein
MSELVNASVEGCAARVQSIRYSRPMPLHGLFSCGSDSDSCKPVTSLLTLAQIRYSKGSRLVLLDWQANPMTFGCGTAEPAHLALAQPGNPLAVKTPRDAASRRSQATGAEALAPT